MALGPRPSAARPPRARSPKALSARPGAGVHWDGWAARRVLDAGRPMRDRRRRPRPRNTHAIARARAYASDVATTVRVSEATRARAAALAASRGRSIGEVVEEALEALETAEFWRKTQEALRRYPVELDEDPVWELSVADGLDRE